MVATTLKTLAEIKAADRTLVGGKAYNCARLLQAGFPVPDAIVVPADATEPELHGLPADHWFETLPADALFAVRSSSVDEDSAEDSFAGIHETHLNVHRREVLEAVLVCRRSARSAQAAAYRGARRLSGEAGPIGVLVQRMVDASISGVAFTTNPVTGRDEIVINAAWGLGEALVSGRVDPDEFVVRKHDLALTSSRRGAQGAGASARRNGESKPALSDAQVAELAALVIRIERYYGAPQDIEWCHDGRQFWIVQSRPVTTAHVAAAVARQTAAATGEIEWTRANLAEVLPEQVSPQALDALEQMLNDAERKFMGRMMADEATLGPIMKAFHGRMYMNLSQLRHVCRISGTPPANMLRSLGHPEQIRREDELPSRPQIGTILRCLPDIVRLTIKDLRAEHVLRRHEASTRDALGRLAALNPRDMPDAEIWRVFEWWRGSTTDVLQVVFVMTNVMLREVALRDACAKAGVPYERLVYSHLAAGERSVSTHQAIDLTSLADVARGEPSASAYLLNTRAFDGYRVTLAGTRFLARFDEFLSRYGHRGRYESDWAIPRLHEDPSPALFAIREQLHGEPRDMAALAERQIADAAEAMREFESRLTPWQTFTLLPRVRSILRRLKQQYVWREQVRSDLTRVLSELRAWHLVLADRFVERGWIDRRDDYFLLLLGEIGAAIADRSSASGLRAIAARRAAVLADEKRLDMPMLMRESELPGLLLRGAGSRIGSSVNGLSADSVGVLTGLCVSPGVAEGTVVVMRDPAEFASMTRGAILVAPATDPSWTPLFTLASGVIVEVGGMLSHASTIAREYGLPALANVKDATRILRTGDRVYLDATGGRVVLRG
jgi:rifampicin phosphotransferase